MLFDGIPLDKVTTSMTINGPAGMIWAMYIATAEKQGVAADQIGGTIQNDILKEYIAQKEFIFPPRPSMRLVTDTFELVRPAPAPLEHHLHQRLPHPGGGQHGGPGTGLHPGRWHRIRALGHGAGPGRGRLRPPALLLLQRPQRLLRRDRQVSGGPADLGHRDAGDLRGQESEIVHAALPHPDRRAAA